jgi:hypothetical protein
MKNKSQYNTLRPIESVIFLTNVSVIHLFESIELNLDRTRLIEKNFIAQGFIIG